MSFPGVAFWVSLSLACGLGLEVASYARNSFQGQKVEVTPAGVGPVKDGAYPFTVALEVSLQENRWSSVCVGALVAPKKVLTSASCYSHFKQYYDRWQIVAGRHYLDTPHLGEQIHGVGTAHLHPNFNNSTPFLPVYDYALLIADAAFENSKWVMPVSIAGPEYTLRKDDLVTGVGWELSLDTTSPYEMQELNQTVISHSWCQNPYDTIGYAVSMNVFCAGLREEIPDNDLRGGPVVHNGTLVGIGTLPFVMESPSYPMLYSNMFRGWPPGSISSSSIRRPVHHNPSRCITIVDGLPKFTKFHSKIHSI